MSQTKTSSTTNTANNSSDSASEKDLTIAKAAFLMLRVRKVLKKKVQKRKEERERKASVSPRPSIAPFDVTSESAACSPEKPIRKFNPKRLIRSRTMPAILTQQKVSPNEAPRRHSHQHYQKDHRSYGKGMSIIAKFISPSSHHAPKPTLLNIPQQYHYHPGPAHPHNHKLSLHEPSFSSHSAEQGGHQRAPPRLEDTLNEGIVNKQIEGTKRNRAVSVDMVRRGISLPGATTMGPVNATTVSSVGGQQSVFVSVPKKVPIMPEGQ